MLNWHRLTPSRLRALTCQSKSTPCDSKLQTYPPGYVSLKPLSWRRAIRVAPIVNDSKLLPPVGVWTVSQFQCD